MTIEEAIYSRLVGDAVLASHVSDRIFPSRVPDYSTPLPYIVYHVTDREPVDALNAIITKSTIEFEVIGDTYLAVRGIGDIVRTLLDQWRGGVVRRSAWTGDETSLIDEEQGYVYTARYDVLEQGGSIVATATALARVVTNGEGIEFKPNGTDSTVVFKADEIRISHIEEINANDARLVIRNPVTNNRWSIALARVL